MFTRILQYLNIQTRKQDGVEDQLLPDLYEVSISELQNGLDDGHYTSADLVKAYLARIEEVNLMSAALHAIIETNPSALTQACELDAERQRKGKRGPVHGIPILLKDNISTRYDEGMDTTAGSFALKGAVVPRDAFIAAKLREAGAIFIGKANMSEWASWRGSSVPSGFSGRGGQTHCPYYPHSDPLGSSSGSAVAMAVGLAAGSIGTETDGSIVLPSSRNNVVGIKPTVGLVSRAGVIPLSRHQDTAGPMCRSVTDAAILLSIIAGPDPRDEMTLYQPGVRPHYTDALNVNALEGKRLGVPRAIISDADEAIAQSFDAALKTLKDLGAEIIDPADLPSSSEMLKSESESCVMTVDFKDDLNRYLSELVDVPTGVRSLAQVIDFNKRHADLELAPPYYTDQSQLEKSEDSHVDDDYLQALADNYRLGRAEGIDAAFKAHKLDALVMPTDRAPLQDDSYLSPKVAAIAGYPMISVPLGFQPDTIEVLPAEPSPLHTQAPGLPFGLAFVGAAYTEFDLISYAYAFEQATHARLKRKAYEEAIPKTQLKHMIAHPSRPVRAAR